MRSSKVNRIEIDDGALDAREAQIWDWLESDIDTEAVYAAAHDQRIVRLARAVRASARPWIANVYTDHGHTIVCVTADSRSAAIDRAAGVRVDVAAIDERARVRRVSDAVEFTVEARRLVGWPCSMSTLIDVLF